MSIAQLLILHMEFGLNHEEIGLALSLPNWKVRELLKDRLKPKNSKRSRKKLENNRKN